MTARRTTSLRQIERSVYKVDRALGDAAAFQRGGFPGLAKRLLRRQVRRRVGRATKGWL